MPFRDLTGKAKPHIGEAIREVVASDLKSLSGVRIVERGSLDKIIKEMRLQTHLKESKTPPPPSSARSSAHR
jgi:hypothetical protein